MGAQQLFEKSLPPVARSTAPGWKIVVARDAVALEAIVPAWEELAAHALEHNPFYEPWVLLPALAASSDDEARTKVRRCMARVGK